MRVSGRARGDGQQDVVNMFGPRQAGTNGQYNSDQKVNKASSRFSQVPQASSWKNCVE